MPKVIILLQTNLPRLSGMCQPHIHHLCLELRLAHPAAPRTRNSKRSISICWLGGAGMASSDSVQSAAGLLPSQLTQRAPRAQCLCNQQSAVCVQGNTGAANRDRGAMQHCPAGPQQFWEVAGFCYVNTLRV